MFELKGKVALITGAAGGLGLSYAKELLKRDLKGVVLVDINEENGAKAISLIKSEFKKPNCVTFVKADVSNIKQLEVAFQRAVDIYGQLDVLINNAGIMNEVQWENCINVNIVGLINGTNLALEKYFPKYRSGPESLILNTSSIVGLIEAEVSPVYVATKTAIVGYTRSIGGNSRYQTSKTRVIAVCPTMMYTDFLNINKAQVAEPYYSQICAAIKGSPGLHPDEAAKYAVDLLSEAPTATVWIITPEGASKAEFPAYGAPVDLPQ